MAAEVNPNYGKKCSTSHQGSLLLLFYAFALQCANDRDNDRKKPTLKWPGQLILMSAFAYIVALIVSDLK
jgi:ferrous iron transport protein B